MSVANSKGVREFVKLGQSGRWVEYVYRCLAVPTLFIYSHL